MRRLQIFGVTLLLIAAVAFGACKPKLEPTPAPAPAPVAVALTPKVPVKEPFEVEWERLVDAAQKEGAVVWYTSLATSLRRPVGDAFKNRFGIRVESITGRAAELTEKILSERRAGIYGVDVITEGSGPIYISYIPNNFLQPIKPVLILPEATDPELIKKTWFQGELPLFVDYGIPLVKFASVPVLINTKLVKPGEITSYMDLLKPEWKEKILMDDTTMPGKGSKWFALVGWEIMGMDWMQKFVQQKPTSQKSFRT